jgi:hypothetical protein
MHSEHLNSALFGLLESDGRGYLAILLDTTATLTDETLELHARLMGAFGIVLGTIYTTSHSNSKGHK